MLICKHVFFDKEMCVCVCMYVFATLLVYKWPHPIKKNKLEYL